MIEWLNRNIVTKLHPIIHPSISLTGSKATGIAEEASNIDSISLLGIMI